MARICEVCSKNPQWGHKISHAHNVSNRRWLPNLQRVRIAEGSNTRHIMACTRCIRSNAVTKGMKLTSAARAALIAAKPAAKPATA